MKFDDPDESLKGTTCCVVAEKGGFLQGTQYQFEVALNQMEKMEANIVDKVARLTLSASDQRDWLDFKSSLDVSFSSEELAPPTSEDIQSPIVSMKTTTLQRSLSRSHKRSSSFLSTPVHSQAEFFLPTPLICNKGRGHSSKKLRNNEGSVARRVPLLPDSPLLDDCHMPVIHKPCFSPYLRSSAAFFEAGARSDYKSDEGVIGVNEMIKDDANPKAECPSLASSRSSSPFLENLPYLDAAFQSFDRTPRMRVLKMRTKTASTIALPALFDYPATSAI